MSNTQARSNPKKRTASEIARAVKSQETTARKVLDETYAVIDRDNPKLNVFVHLNREKAYEQADAIDLAIQKGEDPGPLAGVPVGIKDNFCETDVPTTCASKILQGWRPPYTATSITKLQRAGAISVGKTNMDEFAMGSSTETSFFGSTNNPLDAERVPGGSSGGSTAAVAAGMTPIALGSDTGGSIRQPAAFCGTVGVKPTYGRVSRYGVVPFASSLDQVGTFGQTVEDAALALQAIAGHDPRDTTSLVEAVPNYVESLTRGVEGLRVGVIAEMLSYPDPGIRQAIAEAIEYLSSQGAKVDEVSIPATKAGLSAYYIIAPAEASSNLARFDGVRYGLRVERDEIHAMYKATRAEGFGSEVKRRIMLGTYVLSAGYYDAYYAKAQKVRTLIMQGFAQAFEDYDVLLAPTAPTVAFKHGEFIDDPIAMYMNDVCTLPLNLAGLPGMSVPFGTAEHGLPAGVQVIAPALQESVMFQTAAVLEYGGKR